MPRGLNYCYKAPITRSLNFLFDVIERRLQRLLPTTIGTTDELIMLLEQARVLAFDQQFSAVIARLQALNDAIDLRWFSHALPAQRIHQQPEGLPAARPVITFVMQVTMTTKRVS